MHLLYLVASVLQGAATPAPDMNDGRVYLWIAIAVALVALALAALLARAVIAADSGTAEMQAISNAIREGAEAFLKRQYQTIGAIALVLAVVVFVGYHLSPRTAPYAAKTVISFLVGAVCSGLAGFTGMYCSIRANIRAASAARTSLDRALKLALRGGAVTGLVKTEIVDGAKKAALLREIAARENISLEQVVAVGDGANDLPMLGVAGMGIAFRAKPLVRQSAGHAVSILGLDSLLYLIGVRDRDLEPSMQPVN